MNEVSSFKKYLVKNFPMIWYSTHNLNIVHNISWQEFDKSTLSKLTVKLHQEEMVKAIGILWPRSSKINTAIKCKVIAAIEATTLVNLCHLLTVLFKITVAFTPKTAYLPNTMFVASFISFKFSFYFKMYQETQANYNLVFMLNVFIE